MSLRLLGGALICIFSLGCQALEGRSLCLFGSLPCLQHLELQGLQKMHGKHQDTSARGLGLGAGDWPGQEQGSAGHTPKPEGKLLDRGLDKGAHAEGATAASGRVGADGGRDGAPWVPQCGQAPWEGGAAGLAESRLER